MMIDRNYLLNPDYYSLYKLSDKSTWVCRKIVLCDK